jgi:hypothetical protein
LIWFFLLLFFDNNGDEVLIVSGLLGRCSTTWATPQPFLLWLFLRKGLALYLGGPSLLSFYLYFPHVAGTTGNLHCTQPLVVMGTHKLPPSQGWTSVTYSSIWKALLDLNRILNEYIHRNTQWIVPMMHMFHMLNFIACITFLV